MNWDEPQADFRGAGEPLDPAAVRRLRRRERARLAIEVVAGAGVVGYYAAQLLRGRPAPPPLVVLALVSTLFVGAYLARLFANRREFVRASATDTASFLALLRRKAEADLRWNRGLRGFVIGAAVFGLLWMPWQLAHHADAYRAEPWRAVVGVGGYFAILAALAVHQRRVRRRLVARLERLGDSGPAAG